MKKVFYLGPENSYSDIVVKKVLGKEDYECISCDSFLEIMNNTIITKNSIGVLPIENSITSDIHENIDFFFKNDVSILYEAFLRIRLHLIGLAGTKLKEIQKVYSHPRALAQCTKFMKEYNLEGINSTSTSTARDIVLHQRDKTIGCIGNKDLVQANTLQVIEENIGDSMFNMTRFAFVSFEKNEPMIKTKTTIIFRVLHHPGSLAKLLTQIAENNLNLTKIESRPIPGTDWEYEFWIDIEKPDGNLNMEKLSHILANCTQAYKIMGVYEIGKIFES